MKTWWHHILLRIDVIVSVTYGIVGSLTVMENSGKGVDIESSSKKMFVFFSALLVFLLRTRD